MFDKMRIIDWNSILYSAIILWPTFMFSLIFGAFAWEIKKDFRASLEMLKGLRNSDIGIFIFCCLVALPFFIAFYKSWYWPAFLCVEENGEWRCRNSYYYTLTIIPPAHPRRLESLFRTTTDDDGTEIYFTGGVRICPENTEPFSLEFTSYPLESGDPDFFKKFGYPDNLVLIADSAGRKFTPWHAWNNYGYVYLTDKNQAEYHGETLAE
ncbi:MAG: hypothetical protein GQF41_0709 [Candidatus Rifleibacterium amylolyticum]|nr:MAG: hypothetical protein GQF41_0709 [Candidatus Rifleibacterium amylolyticum]NLF95202.1 hypothetical protein [Candidatus Riflebacteria bacterium]